MIKLSLKKCDSNNIRYKFSTDIVSKYYFENFSGFTSIDGTRIIGTCCRCKNKSCAFYSEQELKTEKFAQFPKNPSNRVCPTNAIQFDDNGVASISSNNCINCGLCLYRCQFAAIQFNPQKGKCYINNNIDGNIVTCTDDEQDDFINQSQQLPLEITYEPITIKFATNYSTEIKNYVASFSDISEIIVRNTFLNLGLKCNVNARGNVHTRTEFFAEDGIFIIIGESEIKNADTLSVNRRILDDIAVLISRYGYSKSNIIPLSVLNGLPNKRTDYYEVIKDIKNILGIQINTVTYHILFILHLYQTELSKTILAKFILDKDNLSLVAPTSDVIANLSKKDATVNTINYIPTK